jgi:hypothetical protein
MASVPLREVARACGSPQGTPAQICRDLAIEASAVVPDWRGQPAVAEAVAADAVARTRERHERARMAHRASDAVKAAAWAETTNRQERDLARLWRRLAPWIDTERSRLEVEGVLYSVVEGRRSIEDIERQLARQLDRAGR